MEKLSKLLFGDEKYPGQWKNDYFFSFILLCIAGMAILFIVSKIK